MVLLPVTLLAPVLRTPQHSIPALCKGLLDGEAISNDIDRRSQSRVSRLDTKTCLCSLTRICVSFESGDRIAIDHTVPVMEIVKPHGFDRLTKGQMQNLIQNPGGEFDNLQVMLLSLNPSK